MSEDTQVMHPPSQPTAVAPTPSPPAFIIQWGSGGEARVSADDRESIDGAIEDCDPRQYRSLFPLHGGFGVISLGVEGRTLWLYTDGGAFIVGELVDPSTARPRGVPASGTVDISSLPSDQQAAIMTLLSGKKRR